MTRTGFFAGSFDPPTLGHVDLIVRARALVERLVVGVGRNADKQGWLALDRRVALLRELVPDDVEVVAFDGLAVAGAREAGAELLIRGVRGVADLESETHMAHANRRLDPGLETVLLVTAPDLAHVSSRLVREVHRSGGDLSLFVPEPVARALETR